MSSPDKVAKKALKSGEAGVGADADGLCELHSAPLPGDFVGMPVTMHRGDPTSPTGTITKIHSCPEHGECLHAQFKGGAVLAYMAQIGVIKLNLVAFDSTSEREEKVVCEYEVLKDRWPWE